MTDIKIINYSYEHVPTVRRFTESKKRIKCIMGCFGSGKSSGCVMHLLLTAKQQKPHPIDKVRYTRYAIIRNTVKELRDTTKKTIDDWISPIRPRWKESEFSYLLEFRLEDGTIVHSEWLLRALDRPEQVRDLLSMELSGAWINEAREIEKEVFDTLDGRIGRYPKRIGKYGCTYPYIIMDTNPPDTDHWLYKYFEELLPRDDLLKEKAELFRQPSGLSPEAENIPNLPPNYYQNLAIGKDPDFIKVAIHGEYGYLKEGKPVFPLFAHNYHVAKTELIPVKSIPIIVGMDFGLYPAAVITQQLPDGRCRVYDELVSLDVTDLASFIKEKLLPLINNKYRYFDIIVIGDPSGSARSSLDSNRTAFTLLKSFGFKAYPAYTNSISARIQAVNDFLTRTVKGEPAFLVSNTCQTLIKALIGKYCFRRIRVAGERYSDYPDKGSIYSHVADALTYACIGYTVRQLVSANPIDDFSVGSLGQTRSVIKTDGWF